MSVKSINKVIFGLYLLGWLLFSLLVMTLSLSERLNRRHPVFNNFLYTWIIFSASGCFQGLALISGKHSLGELSVAQDFKLLTSAVTSTLNLSIHLWLTLPTKKEHSLRTKKLRTLLLVVSPYILGLVAFPALFYLDIVVILELVIRVVVAFVTLVLDVALLVKYWRFKRTVKFSWSRRLLTANIVNSNLNKLFLIVRASYPILAFCVLGLHSDVLHIWSTCLRSHNAGQTSTDEEKAESVLEIHATKDPEAMGQHILESRKEDDISEVTSR